MSREETSLRNGGERGAQSIKRALALLELFSTESPDLSLKELCQRSGLTLPTAHRMAKALQASGYLIHDPLRARYSLGPSVVRLAFVVLRNSDTSRLVALAMPYLEDLRAFTGETVGLQVPTEGGRLCAAEVESRHMMRMATGVGNILPWNSGAASRAMLAYMTESEQRHLLAASEDTPLASARLRWLSDAYPAPAEIDTEELLDSLVKVREQGYAASQGESATGAAAVASAIRNAEDRVIAAINITGPTTRWPREKRLEAVPRLQDTVAAIELLLGRVAD